MPEDITATSLRVGGINEVVNRTHDIVCGTIRGGWGSYFASVATIMEYYQQSNLTLSKGGRAIAGWAVPEETVYPPTCSAFLDDCCTVEECTLLPKFMEQLFDSAHFHIMGSTSKLRSLADCMLASLLQYLQSFLERYGADHIVMVALFDKAAQFNISKEKLLLWGRLIKKDFDRKNIRNSVPAHGDLVPVVKRLHDENRELRRIVKRGERNRDDERLQLNANMANLEEHLVKVNL
jgi:hypothetical protein